jgi:hypothetical protein
MATVEQVTYNSPDGATMGKAATEKISFYGVTPVIQASAITAPVTTASTTTTPYGYTSTQADAIVTSVRAIIVALQNVGITA